MSLLERKITHTSLVGFAWPTILSYIFVNIYFIIDGVFVSQALGTSALAAVNITMPVFGAVMAIATMIVAKIVKNTFFIILLLVTIII